MLSLHGEQTAPRSHVILVLRCFSGLCLLSFGPPSVSGQPTDPPELTLQMGESDAKALADGVRSIFRDRAADECIALRDRGSENNVATRFRVQIRAGTLACRPLERGGGPKQELFQGLVEAARANITIQMVPPGRAVKPGVVIDLYPHGSAGASGPTPDGWAIWIMRPGDLGFGTIPAAVMLGRLIAGDLDLGIIIAHEIGHIVGRRRGQGDGSAIALALENYARTLRDPRAPSRFLHDPPPQ